MLGRSVFNPCRPLPDPGPPFSYPVRTNQIATPRTVMNRGRAVPQLPETLPCLRCRLYPPCPNSVGNREQSATVAASSKSYSRAVGSRRCDPQIRPDHLPRAGCSLFP